ncbi:membrane bound O-acyl transferase family protein [Ceratobasidium sp. AG-Ba]|nr:membrane bound O-acyl transferase family protein [Ceratobasidium sp. AG-Ba]
MFALVKSVEFACAPQGRLKVNEVSPGVLKSSVPNGRTQATHESTPKAANLWTNVRDGFLDACELLSSMRGIGWDYGTGNDIYIPPEHRSLERSAFLRSTLRTTLINFLLLDAIDTGFKLVPGVSSPSGGSIFLPDLSPVPRVLASTALHFATGVAFIGGFNMVYGILTMICVSFGQSPSAWPPVMEDPMTTTSLHDFWGRRWHQLLRQTFLIGGGFPLSFICERTVGFFLGKRAGRSAGLAGLVLGAFTASGLFHMLAMYAMGRGIEWKVVAFFSAQAFALALERSWKALTGRRVDGWWGRIWSYVWVAVGGQWCLDAWHRRGLGGGMVIPPFLSPTRLIVLPLILKLLRA